MSPEPPLLDRIEVLLKLLSAAEEEARRLRVEIAIELAKRREASEGAPTDPTAL